MDVKDWVAQIGAKFDELEADPAWCAERDAAIAARVADEASRARQERIESLQRRGVPGKDIPAFMGESALQETRAMFFAREWLASDRTVLVLSGTRGCGKTVAAGWLVAGSRYGQFLDVTKLQRLSRYEDAAMRQVEDCDLLAIDDLGMEYADAKGSFVALFDGLFNTRYADQRRTVITTNLPVAVFRERYGERVADRIREAGRYVELDDPSLRGQP